MKQGTAEFLKIFGKHIVNTCQKYNIKKLWLFGSAVENITIANDYDFAVSGYPEGKFYEIASKIDRPLDKASDLIDFDLHSKNNHYLVTEIEEEGEIIYERA